MDNSIVETLSLVENERRDDWITIFPYVESEHIYSLGISTGFAPNQVHLRRFLRSIGTVMEARSAG